MKTLDSGTVRTRVPDELNAQKNSEDYQADAIDSTKLHFFTASIGETEGAS
jgi:hypothetical protein